MKEKMEMRDMSEINEIKNELEKRNQTARKYCACSIQLFNPCQFCGLPSKPIIKKEVV